MAHEYLYSLGNHPNEEASRCAMHGSHILKHSIYLLRDCIICLGYGRPATILKLYTIRSISIGNDLLNHSHMPRLLADERLTNIHLLLPHNLERNGGSLIGCPNKRALVSTHDSLDGVAPLLSTNDDGHCYPLSCCCCLYFTGWWGYLSRLSPHLFTKRLGSRMNSPKGLHPREHS